MLFQGFLTPFFDTIFGFHVFPYPECLCLSFSIIRKLTYIIRYTKFFTINALNGLGLQWNVCMLYQCSLELPNDSKIGVSQNDQCILWEAGIWNLHMLIALNKATANLTCWGKRNDNMLLRRSTAKRQIQKMLIPVSTSLLPGHVTAEAPVPINNKHSLQWHGRQSRTGPSVLNSRYWGRKWGCCREIDQRGCKWLKLRTVSQKQDCREGKLWLQETFCIEWLKASRICCTSCLSGGLIWKVTLRLNMFPLYLVAQSRELS